MHCSRSELHAQYLGNKFKGLSTVTLNKYHYFANATNPFSPRYIPGQSNTSIQRSQSEGHDVPSKSKCTYATETCHSVCISINKAMTALATRHIGMESLRAARQILFEG